MASASSLQVSMSIRCSSSATQNERLFVCFGHLRPTLAFPQPQPCSRPRPILASARRQNKNNSPVHSSKTKKQSLSRKDVGEEEDLDDDAFEALFQLLAEDLKNDDLSLVDDDDEEINEEELAKLEQELEETLGDNELMGLFNDASEKEVKGNAEEEDEDEEEDELEEEEDDDDEEEDESEEEGEQEREQVELKRWQLKRLAYALKNGRRKTSERHEPELFNSQKVDESHIREGDREGTLFEYVNEMQLENHQCQSKK